MATFLRVLYIKKLILCGQVFNAIVLNKFEFVPFLILFKQEFIWKYSYL